MAEANLQTLSEAEAAIVELLASFNHHVFLAMDEVRYLPSYFHTSFPNVEVHWQSIFGLSSVENFMIVS